MGLVERKWQEERPGATMWLVLVGCKRLMVGVGRWRFTLALIAKGPEIGHLHL